MSTIGIEVARPALHRGPVRADGVRAAGGVPHNPAQLLRTWLRRARQRRHLLELDERLLRDIGLTRNEVLREAAKPFWRA